MRIDSSALLLCLALLPSALGALLAVDYGGEWIKASLVKPGTPLDVLLDKDSKRKMQSVVGYKRDERVFGGEAANAATRFPKTHFPYAKPLLALPNLPPTNLTSIYPTQPEWDVETEMLYFPHVSAPKYAHHAGDSHVSWTPQEIVAHQLDYIRSLASLAANEPVKDLFLTLPSYTTQHQKRAFKDAAEIAGLNLVGSVSEGAAVGLNYAMTRQFPSLLNGTGEGLSMAQRGAQIHVIYDSGAIKTTASVIAFYTADVAEAPKVTTLKSGKKSALRPKYHATTHVHVLTTSSLPYLGGVQIDQALREILVGDVAEKLGLSVESVKADDRAIRKLWKEAARAKAILSANQEASVNIESLINDEDYRSRVSRTQLIEACQAFSTDFALPIEDALRKANLKIDDVDSFILFGGNTRVPFVQDAIKQALGGAESKIAQNVNTDESAVLGAAYYGASTGRSVVSKLKLKVIEGMESAVGVTLVEETGWKVGSGMGEKVFLPKGTNHSSHHVLSLEKVGDVALKEGLKVKFAYEGDDAPSPAEILELSIENLETSLGKYSPIELASTEIKITTRIDSRGFLQIASVVAHTPTPLATNNEKGSVKDKLKGLFGGKETDKVDAALKELESEVEELEKAQADKEKKVALKFTEKVLGIQPLSAQSKKLAKSRLAAINAVEAEISLRAEARNLLEGYLYRLRGLLGDEPSSKALQRYSTQEEKSILNQGVVDAFDWMNEEGDQANYKTLLQKRKDLEDVELPVIQRYQEALNRPKAIEDFQKVMSVARMFFIEAKQNLTESIKAEEVNKYTESELDGVFTILQENEGWMKEKMIEQKKLEGDVTKDPVLLTTDLNEKGKTLQMALIRLQNKRPPKPKPKATSTTSTESATSTEPSTASPTSTADADQPIETSTEEENEEEKPVTPPHEEL